MNLYLVGYRGTGKSTLAPKIARQIGFTPIDLDREIERSAGRSISEIFAQEGEPVFRELEAVMLRTFADQDRLVVATGGGIILRPENREILKLGFTVWLEAEHGTLLRRLERGRSRPTLTALNLSDEIRHLLEIRSPLYREVARWSVHTSDDRAAGLASEIAQRFLAETGVAPPPV